MLQKMILLVFQRWWDNEKPGIIELHEKLNNKEITSEELIKEAINNAHELQEKCNAFVTIMDDAKSDFIKIRI